MMSVESRDVVRFGLTASFTRVLRCVEDVSEAEAGQLPNNLSPMIWQLGHLALSDGGFFRLAGGTSPAPDSFKGFFRTGSGGAADYPPLSDVRPVYEAAQRELERLAQSRSEEHTSELQSRF